MIWLLFASLATAAPCSADDTAAVVEALTQVPASLRSELATLGFSQACPGATVMSEATAKIGQTPPDYRGMIEMKAVVEAPQRWIAICPGGLDVAQRVAQVAPSEKRGVIWSGCQLAEQGWFTEAEWSAASGLTFLPLMAAQTLVESEIDKGKVREMVRALAGVGP